MSPLCPPTFHCKHRSNHTEKRRNPSGPHGRNDSSPVRSHYPADRENPHRNTLYSSDVQSHLSPLGALCMCVCVRCCTGRVTGGLERIVCWWISTLSPPPHPPLSHTSLSNQKRAWRIVNQSPVPFHLTQALCSMVRSPPAPAWWLGDGTVTPSGDTEV